MARENTAVINGIIAADPKIRVDKNGAPVAAGFMVYAVRRSSATKELLLNGSVYEDQLFVQTKNPKIIKDLIIDQEIRSGDYITIKGTLSTLNTVRKFKCPKCGHINVKDRAVTIYIDPIFIHVNERLREKLTEDIIKKIKSENPGTDDAELSKKTKEELYRKYIEFLTDVNEISNMFFEFGVVTTEPSFYQRENGMSTCDFQIASERARRIVEDGPDKTADFPWVRAYNQTAVDASKYIRKGSVIFIDGAIETKKHSQRVECEQCGAPVEKNILSTYIVPYRIEYIEDWNKPEESEGGDADEKSAE